jgi:hypothetical protein
VVKSASLANGSVTESKTVLMGQMKKNVASNSTFLNFSKLLNIAISVL